jgi:hypothetical protein
MFIYIIRHLNKAYNSGGHPGLSDLGPKEKQLNERQMGFPDIPPCFSGCLLHPLSADHCSECNQRSILSPSGICPRACPFLPYTCFFHRRCHLCFREQILGDQIFRGTGEKDPLLLHSLRVWDDSGCMFLHSASPFCRDLHKGCRDRTGNCFSVLGSCDQCPSHHPDRQDPWL